MNLCASLASLVGVAAIGTLAAGADVAPNPPASVSFELEGLTAQVASIRTWTAFDGKLPAVKSAEHWVSGAMRLQTFDDPMLGSSRLSAGKREMSQGADRYAATIESFAVAGAPKATGRFSEIALVLANKGTKPVTVGPLNATAKTFDARLLAGAPAGLAPRAFLIPGLGSAKTSLAKSFEGKLAVTLGPGEQTWALLVFDVPAKQAQAKLQIKKGPALDVRLP
jgi:hypothetical protein